MPRCELETLHTRMGTPTHHVLYPVYLDPSILSPRHIPYRSECPGCWVAQTVRSTRSTGCDTTSLQLLMLQGLKTGPTKLCSQTDQTSEDCCSGFPGLTPLISTKVMSLPFRSLPSFPVAWRGVARRISQSIGQPCLVVTSPPKLRRPYLARLPDCLTTTFRLLNHLHPRASWRTVSSL